MWRGEGSSLKGSCGYFVVMIPSISCFGKVPSPKIWASFCLLVKQLLELNSYSLELVS